MERTCNHLKEDYPQEFPRHGLILLWPTNSDGKNFFNSLLIFQFNNNKPFIWSKVVRTSFSQIPSGHPQLPYSSAVYSGSGCGWYGGRRWSFSLFRVLNFLKESRLCCTGEMRTTLPDMSILWGGARVSAGAEEVVEEWIRRVDKLYPHPVFRHQGMF